MNSIKAIIFDWGGVLIDDPMPGLTRHCAQALRVSPQAYASAHERHCEPFQRGDISEASFWARVCASLDRPPPSPSSLWGEAFRAVHRSRPAMQGLVGSLRSRGYATALLSNTETPAVDFYHETYPKDLFDTLIFSCAERCRKPDMSIYALTLERLKVRPEQTVFIDDLEANLEPARSLKMKTIRADQQNAVLQGLINRGIQMP